jgi:RHS repeat-associated protein
LSKLALKIAFPEGFVQNGGTYYDFIPLEFNTKQKNITLTIEGYFKNLIINPCFILLKGPINSDWETIFIKKKETCVFLKNQISKFKPQVSDTKTNIGQQGVENEAFAVAAACLAPAAPYKTRCGTGTLALTATGCTGAGATYRWYGPTGALLATNTTGNFTTPSISANTNYSVSCTATACTESTKTPVVASILNPTITKSPTTAICSGSPVNLSAAPTGLTYLWTGSNLSGTSIFNPIATPTATGSYNVTITKDGTSCPASATSITVNPLPAAPTGVITTPLAICSGTSITLAGTCTNSTATWYTVPTGGTALSSATLSPTATATYYVACRNTTTTCQSARVTSQTVTVTTTPASPTSVTKNKTTSCSGTAVVLSATCAGGSIVNWYNALSGGTSLGTGTGFNAFPTANVTYYAACQNGTCSSARVSAGAITITALPASPSVPTVSATAICVGQSVTLASSCVTGNTVNWYTVPTLGTAFATTTPTTNAPTVNTTYYALCKNNTNACESPRVASPAVTVTAIPAVPTAVSASSPTVCSGNPIILNATCATGTIIWYTVATAGTSIGTGNAFSVTPTVNTTYYAACESGICKSTTRGNTGLVTVNATPAAPNITSSGPLTICAGGSVTLTAANCTGTVTWSNTITGTTLMVSTAGLYSATCTSANGCVSNASIASQVIVNGSPTPTIPFQFISICPGTLSTTLTASGCSGTVNWYTSWFNGFEGSGNSLIVNTPTNILYDANGEYQKNYNAVCETNGCPSERKYVYITYEQNFPPNPIISVNTADICLGGFVELNIVSGCGSNNSLVWYINNVATFSNSIPFSHSPTANTEYKAKCFANSFLSGPSSTFDNCFSDFSTPINVTVSSGIPPTQIISASSPTFCSGGTTTLSSSNCTGTTNWSWTNADNTTGTANTTSDLIVTGLTQNRTYKAKCTNGCGVSAAFSNDVIVSYLTAPSPPTITPYQNYPDYNTTLQKFIISNDYIFAYMNGTGCVNSTLTWQDGSQNSFYGPQVYQGTELYAVCKTANGCESVKSNIILVEKCLNVTPTLTASNPNPSPCSVVTLTVGGCPANSTKYLEELDLAGNSISYTQFFGTTTNTFNVTVKNNTSYRVYCSLNGCKSFYSPRVIFNNLNTVIPTFVKKDNNIVCDGTTKILEVNNCQAGIVKWYKRTGFKFNYESTGNTITPPPYAFGPTEVSKSFEYAATCNMFGCESDLSNIFITFYKTPPVPPTIYSSTTINTCLTAPVNLDAQCTFATLYWSSPLLTGNGSSYPLNPVQTGSYYAVCKYQDGSGGCISGPSVNTNVIVSSAIPPTQIIAANNPTFCNGGTTTLSSSNCNGTINWSWTNADNSIGTTNSIGNLIVTDLTQNRTYKAKCTNGCGVSLNFSNEVVINFSINSLTSIPAISTTNSFYNSITGDFIIKNPNGNSFASVTALNCSGTVTWYSNNLQIGFGASFSIPSNIAYDLTASCNINGCESARSNKIKFILCNPVAPVLLTDINNISSCGSVNLSTTNVFVSPNISYTWYRKEMFELNPQYPFPETGTVPNKLITNILSNSEVWVIQKDANDCYTKASNKLIINVINELPQPFITSTPNGIHFSNESSNSQILCDFTSTVLSVSNCQSGTVNWFREGINAPYPPTVETLSQGNSIIHQWPVSYTGFGYIYFAKCINANNCSSNIGNRFYIKNGGITKALTYNFYPDGSATPLPKVGNVITISDQVLGLLSASDGIPAGSAPSLFKNSKWIPPYENVNRLNNRNLEFSPATVSDNGIHYFTTIYDGCPIKDETVIDIKFVSCNCEADIDKLEWQNDKVSNNAVFINNTLTNVVENTYLAPTTTINGTTELNQTITYIDGFGRPKQVINRGVSPTGKDIVQPIAYDHFGRNTINYLPYMAFTGGLLQENALIGIANNYASSAQSQFYANPLFKNDGLAFSKTIIENSPFARVIQQGSVGSNWQPNETNPETANTIKMAYRHSLETDIKKFTYNHDTQAWVMSTYGANELFVNETKDEKNSKIEEFTDVYGQMVCKKVYNSTNNEVLITYSAYDGFGRSRLVFPPLASEKLGAITDFVGFPKTTTSIKDLIFYYDYDARGRIYEKKTPDAAEEELLYNPFNQLVLSRNALQRSKGLWVYTKYDEFGRAFSSGTYTDNRTRVAVLADLNTSFSTVQYGINAYPIGAGVIEKSRSYYDDYPTTVINQLLPGTPLTATAPSEFAFFGAPACNTCIINLKGKMTAMVEKLEIPPGANLALLQKTELLTVSYYDEYNRVIQTRSDNHLGKLEISSIKYDFAGRVLETVKTTGDQITDKYKEWNKNTYDKGERLKMTVQQLTNKNGVQSKKEPVGRYKYNELGEMIEKWQGCKQQVVTYQYNIKGWLQNINGGATPATLKSNKQFFGMELNYNQADGQINQVNWGTVPNFATNAVLPGKRGYTYAYDALDRLLSASYSNITNATENFSLSGMSYDINGNIKTLKRKYKTDFVDDLGYQYDNGNRLKIVTDAGSEANVPAGKNPYFKKNNTVGDDYIYDTGGNLVQDKNRKIVISYNYLGLPEKVLYDNTTSIYYVYDAAGTKIQKQNAPMPEQGTMVNKTIDYLSGMLFMDNTLQQVATAEGRALPALAASALVPAGSSPTLGYRYEYIQTDYFGNARTACRCGEKLNATGDIVPTLASEERINLVQENHYDPWGLNLSDIEGMVAKPLNHYQFNGNSEKGYLPNGDFDYETPFRNYNPALGRFMQVDINADRAVGINPYRFGFNNPVSNYDPNGDYEWKWFANLINRLFYKGSGEVLKDDISGDWFISNQGKVISNGISIGSNLAEVIIPVKRDFDDYSFKNAFSAFNGLTLESETTFGPQIGFQTNNKLFSAGGEIGASLLLKNTKVFIKDGKVESEEELIGQNPKGGLVTYKVGVGSGVGPLSASYEKGYTERIKLLMCSNCKTSSNPESYVEKSGQIFNSLGIERKEIYTYGTYDRVEEKKLFFNASFKAIIGYEIKIYK